MKPLSIGRIASLAAVSLLFSFTRLFAGASPSYSILDIGGMTGSVFVNGINDEGQVIGVSGSQGFIYSDGKITLFNSPAGNLDSTATPLGLNNNGEVVGKAFYDSANPTVPEATQFTNSDPFAIEGTNSIAMAVNDSGEVVGTDGSHISGAFVKIGGTSYELSTLGTGLGTNVTPSAINNSGQVAGQMNVGGFARAFVLSGGTFNNLGTINNAGYQSSARGINAFGDVVGYSYHYQSRAFLYTGGSMQNLGTLADSSGTNDGFQFASQANAINNADEVVGFSSGTFFSTHAFLYTGSTRMLDLNDLAGLSGTGPVLSNAVGINNFGQIAVLGLVSGSESHIYLVNPLAPLQNNPTPGTLQTKFVAGASFSLGGTFTSPGGFGTQAALLGGTSSANQQVNISFDTPANGGFDAGFFSDTATVQGTGTDTFVLQLSYDPAHGTPLYLGWFNPLTSQWVNAVDGNTGGTPNDVGGAYDPATDFVLGDYGVDATNHVAWAVINHNSSFAVTNIEPVPEPGTWAMLAGGFGLLLGTQAMLRRRPPAA